MDALDNLAEEIADLSDLLPLSDLLADVDFQTKQPASLSAHYELPNRSDTVSDRVGLARHHAQISHDIPYTAHVNLNVGRVERAIAASFGEDRDDTLARCLRRQRADRRGKL